MYVQHSLNRLGFNAGPVDGLVGPRTRSAVSAYLTSLGASGGAEGITPALIQRLFEGQQSAA
jgi:peptidoglycan hydrolase-like protein with peptidoglycan-binding domain